MQVELDFLSFLENAASNLYKPSLIELKTNTEVPKRPSIGVCMGNLPEVTDRKRKPSSVSSSKTDALSYPTRSSKRRPIPIDLNQQIDLESDHTETVCRAKAAYIAYVVLEAQKQWIRE